MGDPFAEILAIIDELNAIKEEIAFDWSKKDRDRLIEACKEIKEMCERKLIQMNQ